MTSLALLGGSFDPIHNGHLHIARQILASGLVSGVVFLPNARHNFKKDSVLLDFPTRLELIRSVLEPGMDVWDEDSSGSGYTAELMQTLYQKHTGVTFYFVIGSDNLSGLPRWHDFAWLRGNVRFLIIPRPGFPTPLNVLNRIRRKTLHIVPSVVSSTLVRERIREGKSISGLVPHSLEQRIAELYKPLLEHDVS